MLAVAVAVISMPGSILLRRRQISHLARQCSVEADPVHEVADGAEHSSAYRVASQ
jgi:hypothetical protein